MKNNVIKEIVIEKFGSLPFRIDVRDYKLGVVCTAEMLPYEYELKRVKVKNQGSVGSCVAHSIAEVVEYHNREQENNDKQMSVGFIYGNRRNSTNKSSGMYVREALANACKYGDVYQEDFPENEEVPNAINLFEQRFNSLKDKARPNRFSTYFRLTTAEEIKYAIMNYGPVVFAMDWYEGTKVDKDGIMIINTKKPKTGRHCMIIYGWGPEGWKIQNSWGKNWGDSGAAILPYNVKISEAWGVTDEIVGENPEINKPIYNTTFLRWLAKIFNWFANLFK